MPDAMAMGNDPNHACGIIRRILSPRGSSGRSRMMASAFRSWIAAAPTWPASPEAVAARGFFS